MMSGIDNSWFGTASQKMDWAAARQKTIAENIANADTPNYAPRDVVPFEEHLSRAIGNGRMAPDTVEQESLWGGSIDGNKVVLEEQMTLSNAAASDYHLATTLFRKGYDLITVAIS